MNRALYLSLSNAAILLVSATLTRPRACTVLGAETLYIPTQAKVGLEWATEIEWASQIEWAAFQLRLAEKQVNVLGHDHVAEDAELEIAMYTLQRSFESAPACVVSDGRRW